MHKTRYLAAATVLLGLIFQSTVHAAKTIYRCEKGGQITLTDKPCDESKPAVASSATTIPSSGSPSTVGIWNGQLQYSGTEAGESIPAAHTVVPLTLEFTPDGKVMGASPGNGCNWLGVWAQGGKGIERLITLDVALTSCTYSGLDRRYTGTFLLAVPDSSGQVSLLAYTPPIPGQKIRGYTLGGTLRRR